MNRRNHKKLVEHHERVKRKQQRLQGLQALYATYEVAGQAATRGSYMAQLRSRIQSVKGQLEVMGVAVAPDAAGGKRRRSNHHESLSGSVTRWLRRTFAFSVRQSNRDARTHGRFQRTVNREPWTNLFRALMAHQNEIPVHPPTPKAHSPTRHQRTSKRR